MGYSLLKTADPQSDLWRRCSVLEAEIFVEKGYVGAPEELQSEYEPYGETTTFVAACDEDNVPAGVVRLIRGQHATELKTVRDVMAGRLLAGPSGSPYLRVAGPVIEVGTIAADRSHRMDPGATGRVAFCLYAAVLHEAKSHGADLVYASFDGDYFERFHLIFAPAVQAIGPPTPYMGSPTVPTVVDVPSLEANLPDLFGALLDAGADLRLAK